MQGAIDVWPEPSSQAVTAVLAGQRVAFFTCASSCFALHARLNRLCPVDNKNDSDVLSLSMHTHKLLIEAVKAEGYRAILLPQASWYAERTAGQPAEADMSSNGTGAASAAGGNGTAQGREAAGQDSAQWWRELWRKERSGPSAEAIKELQGLILSSGSDNDSEVSADSTKGGVGSAGDVMAGSSDDEDADSDIQPELLSKAARAQMQADVEDALLPFLCDSTPPASTESGGESGAAPAAGQRTVVEAVSLPESAEAGAASVADKLEQSTVVEAPSTSVPDDESRAPPDADATEHGAVDEASGDQVPADDVADGQSEARQADNGTSAVDATNGASAAAAAENGISAVQDADNDINASEGEGGHVKTRTVWQKLTSWV